MCIFLVVETNNNIYFKVILISQSGKVIHLELDLSHFGLFYEIYLNETIEFNFDLVCLFYLRNEKKIRKVKTL